MMNIVMDHAPVVGLCFFFVVFVVIAYRTYRPSQKNILEQHAFIPLKEEKPHE